jgi:hypothetical protein
MAERFELIGTQGDISCHLRLAYGSAPDDLTPFVITLTPQYVARVLGKTPPLTFHDIEKYADENAGDLREMALREKGTGRLNLVGPGQAAALPLIFLMVAPQAVS